MNQFLLRIIQSNALTSKDKIFSFIKTESIKNEQKSLECW